MLREEINDLEKSIKLTENIFDGKVPKVEQNVWKLKWKVTKVKKDL